MLEIREFQGGWADAVDEILATAFPGPGERDLVRQLRTAGDSALELVALEGGTPAGHILFSTLRVQPATIRLAGLAPVSVAPARQRSGIGGALIREGLARCTTLGFDAVVLLGDPAYYRRFGFTRRAAFPLQSAYSGPAYQALELVDGALAGGPWTVAYPAAFASVD